MDRSTMTYKSGSQTDSMTFRGNIAIVSASLTSGDDPDLREASPWRSDSWSCQLLTALLCDIILPCATDLGWCRCHCRCPRTTSVVTVTASLRWKMASAMLGNHNFEILWFVCFVFRGLQACLWFVTKFASLHWLLVYWTKAPNHSTKSQSLVFISHQVH